MVISGELEEACLKTIVLVAAILQIDQIFNPSGAAECCPNGGLCLLRYEITGLRHDCLIDIMFWVVFFKSHWARWVKVERSQLNFLPVYVQSLSACDVCGSL